MTVTTLELVAAPAPDVTARVFEAVYNAERARLHGDANKVALMVIGAAALVSLGKATAPEYAKFVGDAAIARANEDYDTPDPDDHPDAI